MVRIHRLAALLPATLLSLSSTTPAVAAQASVAHFELSGPLLEKPQGDLGFALGPQPSTLAGLVERIRAADDDPEVKALLVTFESPQIGMAQLDELRDAFAQVDKPVYFHADSLSTGTYALASSGSHVGVTPTGDVWLLGMYVESPYLQGLLGKLDVEADFVHIGDFKSAGEMLYRTGPSPAAEDNMNWLLDGLFGQTVDSIASARFGGNEERARAAIDHGTYTADQALDAGLIDAVQHRQDLVADLRAQYGPELAFISNYGADGGPALDFSNPFGIFKLLAEMSEGAGEPDAPVIAVVHVEGTILPGSETVNPFGGSSGAYSTDIRLALDRAAASSSVAAVVLRVDSPGGSALASEVIYDAVARVRAAGKPVVVSMGDLAASGGYYVSCGADHVVAGPNTITASIGVVGGKLVTTGLWDKLGVSWHEYKRGESADLLSSARPWSEEERQRIHDWMTTVYRDFQGHITEHRGEKLQKSIEELAGGRVFTGRQALDLGLVDQVGGFHDAVRKAAKLARVGEWELRVLPEPPTIFDLFDAGGGEESRPRVALGAEAASLFAGRPAGLVETLLPALESLDPQRGAALRLSLLRLELLHRETVVLMPPVLAVGFE